MNASEHFKAGNLQQAIDAQLKEVKANPADQGRRMFLFELLALGGDLERARKQLDAINYGELERDAGIIAYRQLVECESARRRLLSDGVPPRFLTPPPDHVNLRLEAINRLRENRPAEAAELLNQAAAAVPVLKGELNGKAFEGIRDADDLFAGVLEVMGQGTYFWVPLEQLATVTANAPQYPRDFLWFPAKLETRDGATGDVYLPALYPGSHEHTDSAIKLGRATDWLAPEGGPVRGVGVRTYLVGDDAISLLEWRQLQFT